VTIADPAIALGVLAGTLALLLAGLAVLLRDRGNRQVARRRSTAALRSDRVAPWRRRVHTAVTATPIGRSVADRLQRAGAGHLLAGDVVLVALAGGVAVHLLAGRLLATPAAAMLGVAAVVAADRELDRRVRRRAARFAVQLPDVARTMSNAAAAGMAIPNALALAAREVEEPAATILATAVRQMEVGQSLGGAMAAVEERAPSREMAVLVATLLIQQRAGGDVIEALREISVNLERRRDLRREVDATMAGVRFSSYAVMGLGVAMLAVLESIAPGTLRQLTGTLPGRLVLVVAGALYAGGIVALRRLTRVDA
jgi:tight adherence protein B